MYKMIRYTIAALGLLWAGCGMVRAQVTDMGAMPFLTMETDARSAGMAGAGVSQSDNPWAIYHNAATSTLGEGRLGAGIFAGPWTTGFETSNVLYGVGGFYKLGSKNSILAGFRYMPGPEVGLMDDLGIPTGTTRSKDMALDVGYARKIGKNFGLSLTARWMMSDQGFGDPAANGFAVDIGAVYSHGLSWFEGAQWSAGFRLADIGPKVKMSDGERYALPGRAALGGSLTLPFTANHILACAVDLGYQFQPAGAFVTSLGAEYTFLKHGVVRGGYHIGSSSKGPGNYATLGCGFIAGPVRCDAAWRFGGDRANPHNNTFIFSLGFSL